MFDVRLLFSVKEKEDAHGDPEIQPMKEDDLTFGEYRWENTDLRPLTSQCPQDPQNSKSAAVGWRFLDAGIATELCASTNTLQVLMWRWVL